MSALLEDLRQTLAASPSRVVFIVGTGVSVGALKDSPSVALATWTGLLDNGLRRVHELGGLDAGTLAHYRRQLGLTHTLALLGVADIVSHGLSAPGGGEFSRWLRESVGTFHNDIRSPDVLRVLAAHQQRGALIATTNYDHLLESVTMLKPTTWRRATAVERTLRGIEPRILHLHGEWEDPDSIILGTRSYADIVRDPHAQAVLTTLRTDRTFIFVGCGAGLRDPNIGAFLRWTSEVFARSEARHFRLCLNRELDALRQEHPAEQRIIPISYGETHAALAPFLHSLLPARTSFRSSSGPPRHPSLPNILPPPSSQVHGESEGAPPQPPSRTRNSRAWIRGILYVTIVSLVPVICLALQGREPEAPTRDPDSNRQSSTSSWGTTLAKVSTQTLATLLTPSLSSRSSQSHENHALKLRLKEERKGEPDGFPCRLWDIRTVEGPRGSKVNQINLDITAPAGGSMVASEKRFVKREDGWVVVPQLIVPAHSTLKIGGWNYYRASCGLSTCWERSLVKSENVEIPTTIERGEMWVGEFLVSARCTAH